MWLVAGLGNPGPEYRGTKHNVGFDALDLLADQLGAPGWKKQGKALVTRGTRSGEQITLMKPMTFMNLSGEAVGQLVRYLKLGADKLIVVHDELDFEPGVMRLKFGGGAGGHNGLRSILSHVSGEFGRVRIGVGKPPRGDGAGWVLTGFHPDAKPYIQDALTHATDAVLRVVDDGFAASMQLFNRNPSKPQSDSETEPKEKL